MTADAERSPQDPRPAAPSTEAGTSARLRLVARSAGSGVAIAVMAALAGYTQIPIALVPFATSIVLVMGLPDAEPAQPRALIGGHLVSTVVGLAVAYAFGTEPWVAAVGVGLATGAMHLTRTFHPPAGIDPLVVVTGHVTPMFLLHPVIGGVVLLSLFAYLWHRTFQSGPWPVRWW